MIPLAIGRGAKRIEDYACFGCRRDYTYLRVVIEEALSYAGEKVYRS